MIPGFGRVGGEFERVDEVVGARPDGFQIERGGDEDDAVEGDPAIDQVAGEAGGAEGPVLSPATKSGESVRSPRVTYIRMNSPTNCRSPCTPFIRRAISTVLARL